MKKEYQDNVKMTDLASSHHIFLQKAVLIRSVMIMLTAVLTADIALAWQMTPEGGKGAQVVISQETLRQRLADRGNVILIINAFMKSLISFTFSSPLAPTMRLEVVASELLGINGQEVSYEQK